MPSVEESLHLLPGETLLSVRELAAHDPPSLPCPWRALCRLASVERVQEVGLAGPLLASCVGEENAGEPELRLFEAVFGRDALISALILRDLFPRLLEETVRYLAAFQGAAFCVCREEEPGKIAHEIRSPDDPRAAELARTRGWGWPYYGSIDATCLFIHACCAAATRREGFLRERLADGRLLVHALEGALNWLAQKLSEDELGLLGYRAAFSGSLENQAWKDSWDAYFHASGELANTRAPIYSLEVQALAYDALLEAAALLGRRWPLSLAKRLSRELERFWVEDGEGGFYALALDRDPRSRRVRQLAVRTSNQGWLLRSRILDGQPQRVARVRELLRSPEFLAPAGVRALSSREIRYRPRAYHANVWLFDNYLIAEGLRRHGYLADADELERRLLWACERTRRYPEFVGGLERGELLCRRVVDVRDAHGRRNRIEQPPQELQAWTLAAYIACRERQKRNRRRVGAQQPRTGSCSALR